MPTIEAAVHRDETLSPGASATPSAAAAQAENAPPRARTASFQLLPSISETLIVGDNNEWLFAEDLPAEPDRLQLLFNAYFDQTQAINQFLHRPSFLRAFADGGLVEKHGSALLHIVCALGAIHYAAKEAPITSTDDHPGKAWVEKARATVLDKIGEVNIPNLMTLVLLWHYNHCHGNSQSSSLSLMIAACCSRALQILRLDVVSPGDSEIQGPPERVTEEESRRRLFWACWYIDINVAAGVDRLITTSRRLPVVPLPRCEHDYIYQIPTPTCRLGPDASAESGTANAWERQGLEAWNLRITYLRGLTLQCVRDGNASPLPWNRGSPFLQLVDQLQDWARVLPGHLQLTEQNMFVHHDQRRLSSFMGMHLAFHVCHCDLFRVMMPGYTFPIANALEDAPADFVRFFQRDCKYHAEMITKVFQMALTYGRDVRGEMLCRVSAYESSRIQMLATKLEEPTDHHSGSSEREGLRRARQNLDVNFSVLDLVVPDPEQKEKCFRSLLRLAHDTPLAGHATRWFCQADGNGGGVGVEPHHHHTASATAMHLVGGPDTADSGNGPDHPASQEHLHPLALFRLAWTEITSATSPPASIITNNTTTTPRSQPDLSISAATNTRNTKKARPPTSTTVNLQETTLPVFPPPATTTTTTTQTSLSVSASARGRNDDNDNTQQQLTSPPAPAPPLGGFEPSQEQQQPVQMSMPFYQCPVGFTGFDPFEPWELYEM
ncbi:hypothetical protein LTS17_005599 [Exophiala oligosperma]